MHGSAALGITLVVLQVLPHEDMTAGIVKRYPRLYLPSNFMASCDCSGFSYISQWRRVCNLGMTGPFSLILKQNKPRLARY